MGFLSFIKGLFSKPATPAPHIIEVDGKMVDLSLFSAEELEVWHSFRIAQSEKREAELSSYLVQLEAEGARLAAVEDHAIIEGAIARLYGEDIAKKIIAQDIEPGMTLDHLSAAFGGSPIIESDGPGYLTVIYGSKESGNYFELHNRVITKAVIRKKTLPPIFFDDTEQE
jgi:hypothetical protein